MEILGIGPLEFLLIFVIILLVLGPKDIEKTARNLGKNLNKLYRSQNYQVIRKASEEIRNLPARLAAEAQLEELKEMAEFKELKEDLNETVKEINTAATDPLRAWTEEHQRSEAEIMAEVKAGLPGAAKPAAAEPRIAPPAAPAASATPALTAVSADPPAAPPSTDGPQS
ncbi:MAG: twin-arginine translocase TatA/TatE family subunit [Anaerolineales bacterium]|nr:twin-arginine translocase TatA/TatE family subunit [Anaerolineales bacterium]